jgi:hypothetical protein
MCRPSDPFAAANPISQAEQPRSRRLDAECPELPEVALALLQAARLLGIEPVCYERMLRLLVSTGQPATSGDSITRPRGTG